jgi:hypothetical protein
MKLSAVILTTIFMTAVAYCQGTATQKNNPRGNRPLGLSLNLGGPTILASFSADYFILPMLDIEAGGGIWGYFGGMKLHINGNQPKNSTLYSGVVLTAFPPLPESDRFYKAGWNVPKPKTIYDLYVPVGITDISSSGYTFSLEIATSRCIMKWKVPFIFSAKFGYHFKP